MALSTSWEVIARKDFTINGYDYNAKVWARLNPNNPQSITNNESYVDLELDLYCSVWTRYYNTDFYLTGTGWIGYAYREWSDGETWAAASSTITVKHSDDGTGSFTATGGYEFGGAGIEATTFTSGNIALPTIARASIPSINNYPTSNPTFNLGDEITIHMNRKSTSFTHTVIFKYGTKTKRIGDEKGVINNVTFQTSSVASDILALIPNAGSYSGTIEVTTYNGDTQIGSTQSIPYTAVVPNTYAPVISETDYVINETATALEGKGVAGDQVVRFLSKKSISIKVTAGTGTTISKVVCSNGDKSVQMTLSSGKYTCVMNAPPSKTFVITATDARGLQSTLTKAGSIKLYEYPTIQASSLARASATANTGTLTANGTFWNGKAGTTTNAATIDFKLNTASQYTVSTGTRDGANWSISQAMTGLVYTNSYSCVIRVTDSFDQHASVTVHLPPSSPVVQIGDNTVQVNDYILAKTNIGIGTGGNISTTLTGVENYMKSQLCDLLGTFNGAKNLLPNSIGFGSGEGTLSGIHYCCLYDGRILISGTATADVNLFFGTWQWDREDADVIFNGGADGGSSSKYYMFLQNQDTSTVVGSLYSSSDEVEIHMEQAARYGLYIKVKSGTTIATSPQLIFSPMLRHKDVLSNKYVPYSSTGLRYYMYQPNGNNSVIALVLGRIHILLGYSSGGQSINFGFSYDTVPMVLVGQTPTGNIDGKPDTRVAKVTVSNMWLDTNYGSNTKYYIGYMVVGVCTNSPFAKDSRLT